MNASTIEPIRLTSIEADNIHMCLFIPEKDFTKLLFNIFDFQFKIDQQPYIKDFEMFFGLPII
jgi:hypothetical protein